MSLFEAEWKATDGMTAPEMLRYLLTEKFPKRCVVTSALRARSVTVLNMIAEIDRATPVIFCHAPVVYAESVEYRARIVDLLGLTDVRDHDEARSGVPGEEPDHSEELRSTVWGGGIDRTVVHLNKSLAGFDCWISAVYHRPYSRDATPRLASEGRLLRVDPLIGWTQEQVRSYMAEHDLPLHPLIVMPRPKPTSDESADVPTYHY